MQRRAKMKRQPLTHFSPRRVTLQTLSRSKTSLGLAKASLSRGIFRERFFDQLPGTIRSADTSDNVYTFQVDDPVKMIVWLVDASTRPDCLARYISDVDPFHKKNCEPRVVRKGQDWVIAFYATTCLAEGDKLRFSYGTKDAPCRKECYWTKICGLATQKSKRKRNFEPNMDKKKMNDAVVTKKATEVSNDESGESEDNQKLKDAVVTKKATENSNDESGKSKDNQKRKDAVVTKKATEVSNDESGESKDNQKLKDAVVTKKAKEVSNDESGESEDNQKLKDAVVTKKAKEVSNDESGKSKDNQKLKDAVVTKQAKEVLNDVPGTSKVCESINLGGRRSNRRTRKGGKIMSQQNLERSDSGEKLDPSQEFPDYTFL